MTPRTLWLPIACGIALPALFALGVFVLAVGMSASAAQQHPGEEAASGPGSALHDAIPAPFLELYMRAAARFGLDWSVLAGVGRVECDHGRDPDPSCSRPGAVNAAGAGGPMQFLASTWARYGVDGDGDGRRDRWDSADAIFSAANYLRASGAPGDYRTALYAYNRATSYVEEVLQWAARYRGLVGAPAPEASLRPPRPQAGPSPTPVLLIPGQHARLDPANPHLALIPAEAPAAVRAMLVAGDELQGLGYGPEGHPDPRGSPREDCSSTVNYVLYRAGVRPISEIVSENPLAQDYVTWGSPGPGRWVTIYATDAPTPHVFITLAGLRLDTSHDGTDVGPNRDEDGPRWRILDHIPTWAHWSVRHPPGL